MSGGAAPYGRPQVTHEIMPGKFENAGQREPWEKENGWTDCVAEGRQMFGATRLDHGA